MKAIVLGAGVIGTTSAWYLMQAGFDVTVIERQPGCALETSRANGGQISVSHAQPWAAPGVPARALRWMLRRDAPILIRPRADPALWRWLVAALRECRDERFAHNLRRLVALGRYSRDQLRALRSATGFGYHQLARGILHLYTDAAAFEDARRTAALMRELGVVREEVDPAEAVRIEPALAGIAARLAGASFAANDESGDAQRFTQRLGQAAAALGVRFLFGHHVLALRAAGNRLEAVELVDAAQRHHRLRADLVVVALGAYSTRLVAALGIELPIYPVKGYSITVPVRRPERTPTVSLTDEQHRIVISRLGEHLRIAGTAEFAGYDVSLDRRRCELLVRRGREFFGDALDWDQAQPWAGLRPATPSNLPHVGRTGIDGLMLNTGHGTLGWTLACGSARLLADLAAGRRPEIDWPESADR